MDPVLALTQELIRCPSVTPDDAGCQQIIANRLKSVGFKCEHLRFGVVDNLWATYGNDGPLFVFAGHTDVVPPGDLKAWHTPPFDPIISDGMLFGRGAADMKSGLAAMIVAVETFLKNHPAPNIRIGFLITSDEEGDAQDGTKRVIDTLVARGVTMDYCIVGEPSSSNILGDTIRIGRRGSLSGILTVQGIQGHVAYPHLADNPIHRLSHAVSALTNKTWDHGNDAFPPTSFQISNIHAGDGIENVIPGTAEARFNFRFSTASSEASLKARTEEIISQHIDNYRINWRLSGNPFLSKRGNLIEAATSAIQKISGITPELSTGGGTSDGRFIAPNCPEILELGGMNTSIHQINEHTRVSDLTKLADMYCYILNNLMV